jgi:hypothetical protein
MHGAQPRQNTNYIYRSEYLNSKAGRAEFGDEEE